MLSSVFNTKLFIISANSDWLSKEKHLSDSSKIRFFFIATGIPADIASISLTPATWYCSLNYQTGAPAGQVSNQERAVAVPANYVGTTGMLTTSIFGFSATTEWTTDVVITAKDGNGSTLGTATITDAAFKRNRASEYSGPLFGSAGAATVSIEDGWLDALTGSW